MKSSVQNVLLAIVLLIVILAVLPSQGISALSFGEIAVFSVIGVFGVIKLISEFGYASYSMNIMHWIFFIFFFFLAPVIQIAFNYSPWGVNLTTNEIVRSGLFVIIWGISYSVGNRFGNKLQIRVDTDRDENYYSEMITQGYIIELTILSLICAAILVSNTGLANMFARSTSSVSYEGVNSKMLSLIVSRCTRATIVYTNAVIILNYIKKKQHLVALILNLAILIITCFPTSLARYEAGTIYIGIIILLASNNVERFRKSGKFIYIFLFGFMILFPAINVFRRADFWSADVSTSVENVLDNLTENYLSGDYDAFSLIGDTIKYVSSNGIQWGRQLIGALLFFVPRSLWKSKPYGSGQTIFEWMNASFTNISCPLLAEGYINFGVIGIILFGFVTGFIAKYVDRRYWENTEQNGVVHGYLNLFYPFLIILYFFLLRGDLMTTWAYMAAYMFMFGFLHYLMRYKFVLGR